MGLSSSQARLLTLTARMHQIEYKAAKLEAQKLQMANESRKVYEEYLNALDATKIQRAVLNNNGAVKYIDTSYNDLCFNANSRYGLFSTNDSKPIIPENIATKYEANKFDPAAFATAMTGYVPTVIPEFGFDGEYTPPVNAEEITPNTNFSIAMGDAKHTTVSGPDEITLTLSNGLTTSGYTYSIRSNDETPCDVSFQYLNNGRLVISGDNLTITANGSQNDDIILLGNNNFLSTGAGNDIVRVGYTLGQNTYRGNGFNNEIDTGSGTDHVVLGATGCGVTNAENVLYLSSDIKTRSIVTGTTNEWTWYQSSDANINATSQSANTYEGPASQGSVGDCRLFSIINSLGKNTNNGNLTNYVTINKSGTNYSVTFNNYPDAAHKTTTITENEVKNTQNVTGDLTTILIDLAINKLMVENRDDARLQNSETNVNNAFSRADYNTVSLYFFGNRKVDWADTYSEFNTQYQKYKNNANTEYSNLIVGFKTSNEELGIVSGHAYSVKSVTTNYVEVVNPWDDADVLRLSRNDFETYYDHSYVFGAGSDTITYQNAVSAVDSENNIVVSDYASGNDAEWNYFFNLHQQITKAGGYEIISAENTGKSEYLTNIITGGYAYLVMYDNKTNAFVDTSVAINTSLQEVADESMLRKAEAQYEADMRKIDAKDKKYDLDLAAIDNERNAIKSEIETLKTIAKDNVERTFKLFS